MEKDLLLPTPKETFNDHFWYNVDRLKEPLYVWRSKQPSLLTYDLKLLITKNIKSIVCSYCLILDQPEELSWDLIKKNVWFINLVRHCTPFLTGTYDGETLDSISLKILLRERDKMSLSTRDNMGLYRWNNLVVSESDYLRLVSVNGLLVEHAHNQTENICMVAAQQNPLSIKFIRDKELALEISSKISKETSIH